MRSRMSVMDRLPAVDPAVVASATRDRPPVSGDDILAELRDALARVPEVDVRRLADAVRRSADQLPEVDVSRLAETIRRSAERVPEHLPHPGPIRLPADAPIPEAIVAAVPFVERRRSRSPWRALALALGLAVIALTIAIPALGILRRVRRRAPVVVETMGGPGRPASWDAAPDRPGGAEAAAATGGNAPADATADATAARDDAGAPAGDESPSGEPAAGDERAAGGATDDEGVASDARTSTSE